MRTFVIMRLTFLEAVRRKIALAAFVLGVAFLVLFSLALYFIVSNSELTTEAVAIQNQVMNFLTNAGFYAVNFLTIAMSALVSADTLSGEISSGTVQTLATKPVHRAEIVLGKWLGFAILIALYLALMLSGVVGIVYGISRYIVPNVGAGVLLIYLEALLIMTLTVMFSSMFSTLATGGVVFGLYGIAFIGGFVEQIGAVLRNQTVVNIGILSSLLLPTEAVFRRAAFEMTSPVAQMMGISAGPTFVASVPSPMMTYYAIGYLAVALGIAVWNFSERDL